jgi:hypothetical protein
VSHALVDGSADRLRANFVADFAAAGVQVVSLGLVPGANDTSTSRLVRAYDTGSPGEVLTRTARAFPRLREGLCRPARERQRGVLLTTRTGATHERDDPTDPSRAGSSRERSGSVPLPAPTRPPEHRRGCGSQPVRIWYKAWRSLAERPSYGQSHGEPSVGQQDTPRSKWRCYLAFP